MFNNTSCALQSRQESRVGAGRHENPDAARLAEGVVLGDSIAMFARVEWRPLAAAGMWWCLQTVGLQTLAIPVPAHAAGTDIYPAPKQARADLGAALAEAAATHRRVILDFGGNWCPDCHVLDTYLHDAANGPLLTAGFVLVHVNIGRLNENLDIAKRYRIPLQKGVPALAVLESDGALMFSQTAGEFEAMRGLQSGAVTEFLTRWKPAAPPG